MDDIGRMRLGVPCGNCGHHHPRMSCTDYKEYIAERVQRMVSECESAMQHGGADTKTLTTDTVFHREGAVSPTSELFTKIVQLEAALGTEQFRHEAWRKRAEEAEQRVSNLRMALPSHNQAYSPVLRDVITERIRQDEQWGGPAHDDEHTPLEWLSFIDKQHGAALGDDDVTDGPLRERLIKIAALAVAAVESLDRKDK